MNEVITTRAVPAGTMAVARFVPPGPTMADWLRMAEVLAASGRASGLPDMLLGDPSAVVAKMLHAQALDIPLWTAVQDTFVVDGQVGMSAALMRALLLRAGHQYDVERCDKTMCTMTLYRVEQPTKVLRCSWTLEEATVAGLTKKAVWERYPTDMLAARCTGRLVRRYAPDVARGFGYTREELEQAAADRHHGQWMATSELDDEVAETVRLVDAAEDQSSVEAIARRAALAGLMQQTTADGTPLREYLTRTWRALSPAKAGHDDDEPDTGGTGTDALPADEKQVTVALPVGGGLLMDDPGTATGACGCRLVEVVANGDHSVGCSLRVHQEVAQQ